MNGRGPVDSGPAPRACRGDPSSSTSRRGPIARCSRSSARTPRSRCSTASPSSGPSSRRSTAHRPVAPRRGAAVGVLPVATGGRPAARPAQLLRAAPGPEPQQADPSDEQSHCSGGCASASSGLSAGHSIAHVLAMEGLAGELRLADFDTIELSNLNRLPGTVLDLGVNKAVAGRPAHRRDRPLPPGRRRSPRAIREDNLGAFLDGLDLVIEECDSLDVKLLVREAARDRRIPVVMQTSDRGVLDVERFDLEPERPIFHGLAARACTPRTSRGSPSRQKAPYVLRMMGAADVSSRGAASLLEVGRTITGWPQLASEVTLGGATAAAVVRRFGHEGPPAVRAGPRRPRRRHRRARAGRRPPEVRRGAAVDATIDTPAGADADEIDRIVDAARRAPSGGNIQPWRFEADDGEIRFYLVPERTTAMDVRFRASYVGIGAALFNARVAAAAERRLGTVKLFPEGYPSRHVATLRLGDASDFEVAPLNSRDPHPGGQPQDRRARTRSTTSTVQLLSRAVEREGAQLRVLPTATGSTSWRTLLAESDRIRFLTPTLHREMMGELRIPGRDTVDEGIDVRTLGARPRRARRARAPAPPRRDGAPRRVAGRRDARHALAGRRHDELGDGGDRRAARRPDLLRPRWRGRRALLAHRRDPWPRRAPGLAGVPLRRRRRGAPWARSASATSTHSPT